MTRADEGRHEPGPGAGWEESWWFDLADVGGRLGAFLRLALRPGAGRSAVEACLVGDGRRPVAVVEHDAPLPRRRGLDVRGDALWVDLVCETPLEHWTVGLEAFGLALDDPGDVVGERTPLGLDLEWEADAAGPRPTAGGYVVGGRVHGDVLVADEVVAVDTWGTWRRAWGDGPSAAVPWAWARTGDGGAWWADGAAPVGSAPIERRHAAPPAVDAGGRPAGARSLCVVTTASGVPGAGWAVEPVRPVSSRRAARAAPGIGQTRS